jgi:tRNA pseudouridine13 synthase
LAGRAVPFWDLLPQAPDVPVVGRGRHSRNVRRGVHRANRFRIRLRAIAGERAELEGRLLNVQRQGTPNYFGEQRFGRDGATLTQALRWTRGGGRKLTRTKRGLYLSALRAFLFNTVLAARVEAGTWNSVGDGDTCMLQGSRSLFYCEQADEGIAARAASGDIHPGLALWGRGAAPDRALAEHSAVCAFLEQQGLELAWRPARLLADDFCWRFCDDGALQLDFALGAGAYATALLAEIVQYEQGM